MDEPSDALQPFKGNLREQARIAARRARGAALGERLARARDRTANAARGARVRLVRASFEARAVARSSATLSGISRDLGRIGKSLEKAAAGRSSTLAGLRSDLEKVGRELRADFSRVEKELPDELAKLGKTLGQDFEQLRLKMRSAEERSKGALLRSSTVAGLAIDSKRVVRRVKEARRGRKVKPAH